MELIDKVNMSLDDIIKQSKDFRNYPRSEGGRRRDFYRSGSRTYDRGGVGPIRKRGNGKRNSCSRKNWDYDSLDILSPFRTGCPSPVGTTTLVVTNLHSGVTDEDLQELFSKFGSIESATVKQDVSGRSLGCAEIVFEHRADAVIAREKYNGVPLDERPMRIEIKPVTDINESANGRVNFFGEEERGRWSGRDESRRRRDFRGGRGGQGRGRNSTVTVEELDAELDEYITNRSPKNKSIKWSSSDSDSD